MPKTRDLAPDAIARARPASQTVHFRRWLRVLSVLFLVWHAGYGVRSDAGSIPPDVYLSAEAQFASSDAIEPRIRAILSRVHGPAHGEAITIDYPLPESLFPPEIVAPTFVWHDPAPDARSWLVDVSFDGDDGHLYVLTDGTRKHRPIDSRCVTEGNVIAETPRQASERNWTPNASSWETMKRRSVAGNAGVTIHGLAGPVGAQELVSSGVVRFRTSRDPVGAAIFYRDVPIMPTKTREGVIQPLPSSMFPLVQWRLRRLSEPAAPVVMEQLPTCANCHSFTRDGGTLGMDMDGPSGDKGAYVVKDVAPVMNLEQRDVFSWNDFDGRPPETTIFGLFSQISPDGRFVVSTVNEEIFVTNYPDVTFSQTFYPTRGILGIHDRATGRIYRLPGADDPAYVQANPTWSPDGREIVFLRADARPAYGDGPRPTHANDPAETEIRYDLYRVPFNDGRGGEPRPVTGASNDGTSHSFPRFSPDGKWIVFVKANNGLLLRPDSELYILPAAGGTARRMRCNTNRMNSWHSWSPNSRWLVFSSKVNTPFTQMFLTHVDADGNDTPPILVPDSTAANRAVNLPEFTPIPPGGLVKINAPGVEYRRRLDAARELAERGDTDGAIAELRRSIELKPDYRDSRLTLADLLYRQGAIEEAIEQYLHAVELNPRHHQTLHNLGVALGRAGRHEEAIERLRAAIEVNSGVAMTHSVLAKNLAMVGRTEEAGTQFRIALEIEPDLTHAFLEWGTAKLRRGEVDEAIALLSRAAESALDDRTARHRLGLALLRAERPEEAAARFREAIRIEPDFGPAYDALARVLTAPRASSQEHTEAVRLAEIACELTGSNNEDYLHTLSIAYASVQRYNDAAQTADRAGKLAREHGRAGLARRIEEDLRTYLAAGKNRDAP